MTPNTAIYLYGSYAKNLQKEDSDIDIAVIIDIISNNYLTTIPFIVENQTKYKFLIEPVLLTKNEPYDPLYETVLSFRIRIE